MNQERQLPYKCQIYKLYPRPPVRYRPHGKQQASPRTLVSNQHGHQADQHRRQAQVVPDRRGPAVPPEVPEDGLGGVGCDVGVGVGLARDDGVDVREADVVAVEAVTLVDHAEALVVGLDEGYVDALDARQTDEQMVSMNKPTTRSTSSKEGVGGVPQRPETHREQSRAVHGDLDDLDGGVVAGLDGGVGRQRHLGQAHGARVGVLGRAQDLEGADHGEAHVRGPAVRAVGAEAQVHVHEGRGVALEPARLEGDGAAGRGPVGPVRCRWVATTCACLCQ